MSWRDAPCTERQCFGILRLLRVLPPTILSYDNKFKKLSDDLVNGKFKATKGEASDIMTTLHSISVHKTRKYSHQDIYKLFPGYYGYQVKGHKARKEDK